MPELQHASREATVPADAGLDPGLRRYMRAIYNRVGAGLLLAGGLAHVTATVPLLREALFMPAAASGGGARLTALGGCVAISPLVVLAASGGALSRATPLSTGAVYWAVVSLLGASMGVVVLSFTGLSIATTLALTAAAFGALSLAGYLTRRDLAALGAFLTVGLFGVIGALVLNLLLGSPAVAFLANATGALVFAGLIAFETQRLKTVYHRLDRDPAALAVAANYGALSLFLSFLNLFSVLLALASGERR